MKVFQTIESTVKVARNGRLGEEAVALTRRILRRGSGICWNPSSKWVIRTGAGLFFAQDTGNRALTWLATLRAAAATLRRPPSRT